MRLLVLITLWVGRPVARGLLYPICSISYSFPAAPNGPRATTYDAFCSGPVVERCVSALPRLRLDDS